MEVERVRHQEVDIQSLLGVNPQKEPRPENVKILTNIF
jgi:hypothetical protein